jgi:hypothetical protein
MCRSDMAGWAQAHVQPAAAHATRTLRCGASPIRRSSKCLPPDYTSQHTHLALVRALLPVACGEQVAPYARRNRLHTAERTAHAAAAQRMQQPARLRNTSDTAAPNSCKSSSRHNTRQQRDLTPRQSSFKLFPCSSPQANMHTHVLLSAHRSSSQSSHSVTVQSSQCTHLYILYCPDRICKCLNLQLQRTA